jgi:hypothetical protein
MLTVQQYGTYGSGIYTQADMDAEALFRVWTLAPDSNNSLDSPTSPDHVIIKNVVNDGYMSGIYHPLRRRPWPHFSTRNSVINS